MKTRHRAVLVPWLLAATASPAWAQDVTVRVRGYVQADTRLFFVDSAAPAANSFILRRVRPLIEATAFKYFDVRLMPDFAEGKAQLMDAHVDLRFRPQLVLRSGKFKPPLGLERLQSATDIRFVERGLPTNLVPSRDVGLELHGEFAGGAFSYAVGVFDGTADLGNNDGDRTDDKDLVGRVFLVLKGVGLGIAGGTGHETGSAGTPALAAYRTPGQRTLFAYRADGTAGGTVVADGLRQRVVPQGYVYAGPVGLLWEYAVSSQRVRIGTASQRLTHRAWQVAGSLLVTGERSSYRGVTPAHPFDPETRGLGALELALRYGELRVDTAAFPVFANPAATASVERSLGLGLNWYLARGIKLTLNYDRTGFDAAGVAAERAAEHFVVTRVQMGF